jgi:hypothetical protein
VDAIFTDQSGAPFNVVLSGDPANTSRTGAERPELIGTPIDDCGSRLVNCIPNASQAFAQPALGTYGDTPRDMLFGPGLWDLDFALQKDFRIKERANFQFRAQFFNVFNHPNFAPPGAAAGTSFGGSNTFGSSTFGDITALAGANPTRVIQFMGRLTF